MPEPRPCCRGAQVAADCRMMKANPQEEKASQRLGAFLCLLVCKVVARWAQALIGGVHSMLRVQGDIASPQDVNLVKQASRSWRGRLPLSAEVSGGDAW